MLAPLFEALDRGDIDAALKDAARDFIFDFSQSIGLVMKGLPHLGPLAPESLHLAEPVNAFLRGRDGIEVLTHGAWVWRFRDGRVARITFYQERREALEAAGLSE